MKTDTGNDTQQTFLLLRALDKSTGITKWQTEISSEKSLAVETAYLYAFDNYIVFVGSTGEICLTTKLDGQTVWRKSIGAVLSAPPLIADNKIFLATFDRQILNLSLKNGQRMESFTVSEAATVIVQDASANKLIIGDKRGSVTVVDWKKKNQNRKFRSGAEISSLAQTSEGLLVSSFDNFIYLISDSANSVIWKRRLAGRMSTEPQIKQNRIIITSVESSDALVFELSSGRTIDKIALNESNFFSGKPLQLGELFVYPTLRGVVSFGLSSQACQTY